MLNRTLIALASVAGMASALAAPQDPNIDFKSLNAEVKEQVFIDKNCPSKIEDAIPCFKRYSQAGNSAASLALAQLNADPNYFDEPSGITQNSAEAVRYLLLALKQGSLTGCRYVLPWSYQPEIGMTDAQVEASQLGAPREVTSEETETGYVETWTYDDGTRLSFGRSPVSTRYRVLKRIEKTTVR